MRFISVDMLRSGMEVAKDVYTLSGRTLLRQGFILTDAVIKALKDHEFESICIRDELSEGIEINEVIDTTRRLETLNILTKVTRNINQKKFQSLYIKAAEDAVKDIIESVTSNKTLIGNLNTIKLKCDSTYNHSIDVCIIAVAIAKSMGMSEEKVQKLGMGALLHDIGKSLISEGILKKPASLSKEEFEEIKKHPVYGYNAIKDDIATDPIVKSVILLHHEKLDGSGYPMGYKGDQINQYTRIVTVADVYDAMVSDRAYRAKMKFHEAAEYLYTFSNTQFDRDVVMAMRNTVAIYPEGTIVILNGGEKAIVTKTVYKSPLRPIIRMLVTHKEIDLSQHPISLFIVDTCEEEGG